MNYGLILAGGVGQRMRSSGMPKQFLNILGKPIIVYTLEKFQDCTDIDTIVIACNSSYLDLMAKLVAQYNLNKVKKILPGGIDRQGSILNGLEFINQVSDNSDDIVVIHDGVRPLIEIDTISKNIEVTKRTGAAMTVRSSFESVIVSGASQVSFSEFKNREQTYLLTSPQTFNVGLLTDTFKKAVENNEVFLDAALAYTKGGNKIDLVVEKNQNIKITTPEDYYFLKAILELQEQKSVLGI